jgi:hypothetical protein
MSAPRIVSVSFALAAAILAWSGRPLSVNRPPLHADGEACTGSGKACTHDHFCAALCNPWDADCCIYADDWSYYPVLMQ